MSTKSEEFAVNPRVVLQVGHAGIPAPRRRPWLALPLTWDVVSL